MNKTHVGDCRKLLLEMAADGVKVQTCVTSPPYFGLRDYGCAGQIGLEASPMDYVAELVAVFDMVRDVLAEDGNIIAGVRAAEDSSKFTGMLNAMRDIARVTNSPGRDNTVIGVVATNARLTKDHVNKLAQMANGGVARTINPAHTMYDGDTMFALASGEIEANVSVVGAFAAEAVAHAIRNAVLEATSLYDVRAVRDL